MGDILVTPTECTGKYIRYTDSVVMTAMMMMTFQFPSRSKFNCVSILRFRVYKKRHLVTGGHRYQHLQYVYVPEAYLRSVDQYKNLTVGVSLINNADLESDIVEHIFVGSQYMFH